MNYSSSRVYQHTVSPLLQDTMFLFTFLRPYFLEVILRYRWLRNNSQEDSPLHKSWKNDVEASNAEDDDVSSTARVRFRAVLLENRGTPDCGITAVKPDDIGGVGKVRTRMVQENFCRLQ